MEEGYFLLWDKKKKTRTHKPTEEEEIVDNAPKSFVIRRGKVPATVGTLVDDFREVMYPFTAMRLKESDKTNMKEYMKAAGAY